MDMIRTGYLWKLRDSKKVIKLINLKKSYVKLCHTQILFRIGINYGSH